MPFPSVDPTQTQAYYKLKQHSKDVLRQTSLSSLFQKDPCRFTSYSIKHHSLLFDFSKHIVDEKAKQLLLNLASECKLSQAMDAFLRGDHINITENRAVMHPALRHFERLNIDVQFTQPAHEARQKMKAFCDQIHRGEKRGYTQKTFKYLVNIGIGGSSLGPMMVIEALRAYQDKNIKACFVANVDGSNLSEVFKQIEPEETLFLIASKTFTTQETMVNADKARTYMLDYFGGDEKAISYHFAAISTNQTAVKTFGIIPENQFVFWDWVGGRFSLWGSIGLSIALTLGYDRFEQLLRGAEDIDDHFFNTAPEENIPVWMALISFLYTSFWKVHTEAVLPYAEYLHRFPAYLQQAAMESNGKSIDRNGQPVTYLTSPVVWGEPGTNGQHAFYQLLHQGTQLIPVDFIGFQFIPQPYSDQHLILMANLFAQSEGLMQGRTIDEVSSEMKAKGMTDEQIAQIAPYRVFEGGRPSTTLLFDRLSPFSLGQLIALYEHKIFVQGVLWNIYSFDQWGVELGKQLAGDILSELTSDRDKPIHTHDSSTNALIDYVRRGLK